MAVRTRFDFLLRCICITLLAMLVLKIAYNQLGQLFSSTAAGRTDGRADGRSAEVFDNVFSEKEASIKELFRERRFLMNGICEDHVSPDYQLNWQMFEKKRLEKPDGAPQWWERLFVVPKANIVFCSIPQVDSVDWVRHLTHLGMHLSNVPKAQQSRPMALPTDYNWLNFSSSYIVPLSEYPETEAKTILKAYKRVIWVRDPLERLIMAWQDKLQTWDYFSKTRAFEMIKGELPDVTDKELEALMPISLKSFFTYIADQPSSWGFDVNWRPYSELCSVCQVGYDFVLYRETPENADILPFEVDYVFRQALKRADLPRFAVTKPTGDPLQNVTELQRIKRTLLHRVLDVYKLDFALFGFERL